MKDVHLKSRQNAVKKFENSVSEFFYYLRCLHVHLTDPFSAQDILLFNFLIHALRKTYH